jgi:hypothetical protein
LPGNTLIPIYISIYRIVALYAVSFYKASNVTENSKKSTRVSDRSSL